MRLVEHKFKDHLIPNDTKILIIGTFNPNTEHNPADFFYSRKRNHLWKLLPTAYEHQSLVNQSRDQKIQFANGHKIAFIDLIASVKVDEGQEINYDDRYLDGKEIVWNEIIKIIDGLKDLQKVCFTRKTLTDIPKMRTQIINIENHCSSIPIDFAYLVTPARFYSSKKQGIWNIFFTNDHR